MSDEPVFAELSEGFAAALRAECRAPGPRTEFVSGLELALLERQAAAPRRLWGHFTAVFARHTWRYALLLVLVALGAALIAIGPQRVLAQVQQWLGYLPGTGFVDLDRVRVLAAPVEVHQGQISLRVTQVTAGSDQTVLVIDVTGPAAEINDDTPYWADQVRLVSPDGWRHIPQKASLHTEAGQMHAEIVFVALPAGVERVNLEMPAFPIVAEDRQIFWSIPLPLVAVRPEPPQAGGNPPAGNQAVAPYTPQAGGNPPAGNLAVAPYTPQATPASQQGVTVDLLQVAQTGQETGLLVRFAWNDSTWDYRGASVELRDDLGHTYPRLEPAPGTGPGALSYGRHANPAQEMMRFAPLDPRARQLTLRVKFINFTATPRVKFTFDPGDHPTLGQTWSFVGDPAMQLNIAGFQAQVLQAALTAPPVGDLPQVENPPEATVLPQPTAQPAPACRLTFVLAVTPRADAQLISIGSPIVVGGGQGMFGSSSEDNGHHFTLYMDLPQIPAQPLTVEFLYGVLYAQSGWQLTWDLP